MIETSKTSSNEASDGSSDRKVDSLERDLSKLDIDDNEINRWLVNASEITLETKIGKGSYGVVYKGKLRGKEVAVKKLFYSFQDEKGLDAFRKEVTIMSKLRHPNLILFMGSTLEPGNLLIVTELMKRGSVYDLLHSEEYSEQLTFKKRMRMARDAAMGCNWLHMSRPAVIHRDLKTGNLLVDENWNVKVSDFGLSHTKKHSEGVRGSYGAIGTPLWMAPEVLLNKEYNETSDVYSFGIVLWELLTKEDPFEDIDNFDDMLEAVCHQHQRPPIPAYCPPTLAKLIQKCWSPNPEDRPTFDWMLKNQIFDVIVVESIISDETGRKFWEKYYLGEDAVQWMDFAKKFCYYWKIPLSDIKAIKFKCLHAILHEDGDELTVTMEKFSKVLSWFGPMENGADLLDRVFDLVKQPYFHGSLEAGAAEKLLSGKPHKTFLVRFSSKDPGCYAISAVGEDGKIKHYRVYHKPGSPYIIGKTEVPSIQEIVKRYGATDLGLETPCPGSPFEYLFQKAVDRRDISEGYKTVIILE